MARPSTNLDKKMLEAGVQIIIKEGLEGLTARNICYQADVNLGMFNYYFKSKDYYVSLLFAGLKKDRDAFINVASVKDRTSLERLKYVIDKMYEYAKEKQELSRAIFAIFSDIGGKYQVYKDYIEKGTIPIHGDIINLIMQAKEDGYLRQDWSALEMFCMIFFGALVPELYEQQLDDVMQVLKIKKDKVFAKSAFLKRLEIIFNELEVV